MVRIRKRLWLLAILCGLPAAPLSAQVAPAAQFDPIGPLDRAFPDVPPVPAELEMPTLTPLPPATIDDIAREARDGFFQKVIVEGDWLSRQSPGGMGITTSELKMVLALPAPWRDWPLLIIPGVAEHIIDAPPAANLPPRLFDAYTEFRWLPRIGSRLTLDLDLKPGIYRDIDQATDSGLRVTAYGAAIWTWTPTTKLVLGVMYLDREDWNVLPLGGIIWEPYPELKCELLFPDAKIARRIDWFGNTGPDVQDWFYVAGNFGDYKWAIQRNDGARDTVAYSDDRVSVGWERKTFGGVSGNAEVGYVFSRKVSYYDSGQPNFEPPGTLMLRAGLRY